MQQLDVYYQYFPNMFRASLCPSSGEQDVCYCTWCAALVLLDPAGAAQHTTCSNTRLVLLKMGIMMSETCWECTDNKHLTVASCWFSISLHNLLTMHGHRNLKIMRFLLLVVCPVEVLLLSTTYPAARNVLYFCKMFCSVKRAHQGSFLRTDMTFLVGTVFNRVRFSESPVLRTFDTDTWLLESWISRFGLTRVGGSQGGPTSCLWLTKEQDVLNEINSGKNN